MSIKSFKRYEKKFILTKKQYDKLLPKLLKYMDYDEHCKNNKTYEIYNIYYDTNNNDVIRHSISKPFYKEKLRLRSYKTPKSLNDKVFLELKKKINGIVSKRRAVLTLGEAYNFLEYRKRPKEADYISTQVLNEIEYYLTRNDVHPNVYISYSRNAFFAKDDKDFRLTFDTNIIARRNFLTLQDGSFGYPILDPDMYLMEVKILGAMPLWFTQMLSELRIYNTHYSKYGNEFTTFSKNKQENNYLQRRVATC